MFREIIAVLVVSIFVVGSGLTLAQAQPSRAEPEVSYKKKTVYDFEDDLVEGELQRPEGEFIGVQKKAKHSSLIKIREHFIPEMLKSAEDI
ncbi:MAG: hypothetical protein V1754_06820 [Pseudomonadota bacterium]